MATSRFADIVNRLLDLLTARPDCRAAGASGDPERILVLDGVPEWSMTADDPGTRVLVVGGDIESEDGTPGESGQSLATLGQSRNERGLIACCAVVQSGGIVLAAEDGSLSIERPTLRALRAQAFAVMGIVETTIRPDPTLGLAAPHLVCQIGPRVAVSQYLTDNGGAVCSLGFAVQFETRI